MSGITLEQAQTALSNALTAYEKALKARGYSRSGSEISFTKQNQEIDNLLESIDFWDKKVQELSENNSGIIISQYAPSDQ
jgi:hypothetical protein